MTNDQYNLAKSFYEEKTKNKFENLKLYQMNIWLDKAVKSCRTLVIIKPDGVERNLIIPILSFFCKYKIIDLKFIKLTLEQAEEFYSVHRGKSFFKRQTEFMSSGKILAIALEGWYNIVSEVRDIIGATMPKDRKPGTIRYAWGDPDKIYLNVVHASDSVDNAVKEINFFFKKFKK